MDRDNKQLIPKHILDIYSNIHPEKPIPSIWDFGFVEKSILSITKKNPYYETIMSDGSILETYYRTPEYDIYIINSIESFELYFLYDSEVKESVQIAANLFNKHKVKIEE